MAPDPVRQEVGSAPISSKSLSCSPRLSLTHLSSAMLLVHIIESVVPTPILLLVRLATSADQVCIILRYDQVDVPLDLSRHTLCAAKPMTAGPKVAAPIGDAVAKMSNGLFSAADWQCPSYAVPPIVSVDTYHRIIIILVHHTTAVQTSTGLQGRLAMFVTHQRLSKSFIVPGQCFTFNLQRFSAFGSFLSIRVWLSCCSGSAVDSRRTTTSSTSSMIQMMRSTMRCDHCPRFSLFSRDSCLCIHT